MHIYFLSQNRRNNYKVHIYRILKKFLSYFKNESFFFLKFKDKHAGGKITATFYNRIRTNNQVQIVLIHTSCTGISEALKSCICLAFGYLK